MSNFRNNDLHICSHMCEEYGCRRDYEETVRSSYAEHNPNFDRKKTREEALKWLSEKPDFPSGMIASAGVNVKEPPPEKNDQPAVWDLVIRDMMERDEIGLQKYGTRLQPFNGRNSANDLFQELLDAVVYCRQLVEERKEMVEVLKHYATLLKPSSGEEKELILVEINKHDTCPATELLKKLGEL